jgi:hypothetical protein
VLCKNGSVVIREGAGVEAIADLLGQIPASFWGVIVGALVTIVSVVLTNRGNEKRLERQLRHENELKRQERDLALRWDIYLAATDALMAGIASIGEMANPAADDKSPLKGYSEKAPAIAKASLIAREDTAQALARVNSEIAGAALRLAPKYIQLKLLIGQTKTWLTDLKKHVDELGQARDVLLELAVAGTPDELRKKEADAKWRVIRKRVNDLIAKDPTANATLQEQQIQFMQECVREVSAVSKLLNPLLACVRNELGLSFDASFYERLTRETEAKTQANIDTFLQSLPALQKQLANSQSSADGTG